MAKVAYVTGGMGGIGTAICQRLHKEGFKVIAGCGPSRDFVKWLDEQKALRLALRGATEGLNAATTAFAARRMNAHVREALAGRSLDQFAA